MEFRLFIHAVYLFVRAVYILYRNGFKKYRPDCRIIHIPFQCKKPKVARNNIDLFGAYFMHGTVGGISAQIASSFRIFKSLQAHLSYSGGLGITQPREYSYTISNTFQAGFNWPFQRHGAILSAVLDGRLTAYRKPSIDPMFTVYWWKGFLNYKLECLGDFSLWTENRDHGDGMTTVLSAKKISFFAEPQVWYNFKKGLAAGVKINLYYPVLADENFLQLYPSVALRCKL